MKRLKDNKSLIIVIFLILVILGEGIFIFLNSNKQLNLNEGTINAPKEEIIDEVQHLVYDASYELPTKVESYCIYDCSERIYAKDLVVPYINIDSDYAREVNQEIYDLYKELIDIYNGNAEVGSLWYTLVHYDYYIFDNILSVVITTTSGGTDVDYYEYYVYVFDLDNGEKATYEEVYSEANIGSDHIDILVKDAITSIMREELKGLKDPIIDTGDGGYFPFETNFDTFNDESINNYLTSVQNGTLRYFLDGSGKLNIIVALSIPVGVGVFDTIITIDQFFRVIKNLLKANSCSWLFYALLYNRNRKQVGYGDTKVSRKNL